VLACAHAPLRTRSFPRVRHRLGGSFRMCLERSATGRGGERAARDCGNRDCGNRECGNRECGNRECGNREGGSRGNDGAAREGLPRRRAPGTRRLQLRRSALYVCLVSGMRDRIRLPPREVARGPTRGVHGRASGRRLRPGAGAGARSGDAAREKPCVPLFRSHSVHLQRRHAAAAVQRRAPAGAAAQVRVALPRIDLRRMWCWFRRR